MKGILLALLFSVVLSAQQGPRVTVSPIQVGEADLPVQVHGSGFTPNSRVVSHLRRPDLTEYDVIWFATNSNGEFSHTIDTLLLAPGTHDLWVIDDATKVASNTAHLTVDFQPTVSPSPEAQQVLARYVGVWRGENPNILVAITGGNSGKAAGSIAYASSSCGGVLMFRAIYADSIEFFQTPSYGAEGCMGKGSITLKLAADGSAVVSGAATGKLLRLKE